MRRKLFALALGVAAMLTLGTGGIMATDYASPADAQIQTNLPDRGAEAPHDAADSEASSSGEEPDENISADEVEKIDGGEVNWTVETREDSGKEYDQKTSAEEVKVKQIDGDEINGTVETREDSDEE